MFCTVPNDQIRYPIKKNGFRQKLETKFDKNDSNTYIPPSSSGNELKTEEQLSSERSILSSLTNLTETKKVFLSGAEKISKTFNNVRTSIGSFSQKFKISTRRRQRLEEGPMTPACPATPQSRVRAVLGRTPIKLYSPFGIESPVRRSPSVNKENDSPKKTTPSWIPKKTGKKMRAVRMSLSKWNNIVNANQYSDMSPDHKKGCGFKYPIKLRA